MHTPQKYPRAGSQSYPSPAAEAAADGTTTVWFAPSSRTASRAATGSRPTRSKGWFTLLRLYSPRESFFTKEWRLGEIEPAG